MGQQTLPPGFRFSPTDEELVLYYLKSKALGKNSYRATIADVDVYKFEPWDLPGKAALPSKDQEWYFFSAQDKKYSHTARINRTTKKGYWKATGKDRKVFSGSSVIGLKKTLIYYEGRAPNGSRTNWIMHEYRLDEEFEKKEGVVCVAVLCRIRKKGGPGPRNGEQYGALILSENVELEEEESMGKVDGGIDTSRQDDVESRGGGNVYNLTDQVEIWKQMGLTNVKSDHSGTKEYKETGFPKIEPGYSDLGSKPNEKGMAEGDPDLFAYLQSLSDASDMAPLHAYGGDTFLSCDQYLDVQNPGTLFDLDAFSYLPTVWDADGQLLQNYTGSAFDESEILREMSALITDGQGVVGSTGSMIRPTACNVPLDGDYIELDDIKPPLDGFALRPPIHSSELGRSEEQLLWSIADPNVETQKLLHSQGSAAQTSWLPTRTCYERLESARFAIPQAEKYLREGDISIPISREHYRDSGKQPSECSSGAGDLPHVAESSTRSYLSKHVSTYAVSKHAMLPAQLFYASSFTDRQKCAVTVNSSPAAPSTAASAIKGKPNIDADTLRKFPAPPIGLPPSPRLLTKSRKDRAADALKKLPPPAQSFTDRQKCAATVNSSPAASSTAASAMKGRPNIDADTLRKFPAFPIGLPPSPRLLTKSRKDRAADALKKLPPPVSSHSSCSPPIKSNCSSYVEVPSAPQAFDQKAEHENMSYPNRHRWKTPFRVLVGRAKRISLGTRLMELENGMRVKFNDKLSSLGKPGARFLPTRGDGSPFDSLVQGLLATMCQLVAAMLIFFCLSLSFRVLVNCASSVSV